MNITRVPLSHPQGMKFYTAIPRGLKSCWFTNLKSTLLKLGVLKHSQGHFLFFISGQEMNVHNQTLSKKVCLHSYLPFNVNKHSYFCKFSHVSYSEVSEGGLQNPLEPWKSRAVWLFPQTIWVKTLPTAREKLKL